MTDPQRRTRMLDRSGQLSHGIVVVGAARKPWTDIYHAVLTSSWPRFFAILSLGYVLVNVVFAAAYLLEPGSIQHAEPGSFADAFFFSVQTMATIGYGAMAPGTLYAHILVTFEALVGLLGFAVATGVLFAKFARPTARVLFSDVATISSREGVPTLQIRMANQRGNQIVEAHLHVVLARNEVTTDGERMRRFHDLHLVRKSSPLFVLSWTASHRIDADSPLHGSTRESLEASRAEIIVSFVGIDETFSQQVHARHSYIPSEIEWDARFADIISERPDGRRQIDYTRFHDTQPIK